MAQQSAVQAQPGAAFPMFYQRPVPLQAQVHGGISLKRAVNFRFALQTNTIPLNANEFFNAQRDYPIVFTSDPIPTPMAIVGLQDKLNLFVEPDGSWRRGAYVPGYVRRYPFLFATRTDSADLTLCVDETSERIERSQDNPLFRDGKTSEVTQKALDYCVAYQRHHEATLELGRILAQVELVVQRDATVKLNATDSVRVAGFKMIDEDKFNQLPPETFLEWRSKGWIALIYSHLLSLGAWDRLVQIVAERRAAGR
jgi:hypothetical protein